MKALSQAIFAKFTSSALSTLLAGRLYKGRAPENTPYPYAVYLVVSNVPDNTFSDRLEDYLVQFSLYSSNGSSGEVEDLFAALKALYDDCALTITGEQALWMVRRNTTPELEDHTTPTGTIAVWHHPVEYSIKTAVA